MSPIENYIYERHFDPIQSVGNALDDTQSSSLSQKSNNQALQSLSNILADRIHGLAD